MFTYILLFLNASAALLHWHFRKAKFNKSGGNKLGIDIACCLVPDIALIWLHGYSTGFAAFAFYALMIELNIKSNNILGDDRYSKEWHVFQFIQWIAFHILIAHVSIWQYSLALFGIAVFFFDGLQNINWKPGGKRPWFYVGEHSGAIDTWINKKSYPTLPSKNSSWTKKINYWIFKNKSPEQIKKVLYFISASVCVLPLLKMWFL